MKKWIAGAAAMLLAAVVFAASDTIEDRLKPVGELCMAGEECAAAVQAVAAEPGAPRSGADVYDTKCATCHATGAAGAPKLGDVAAWSPRIGKGIDVLYSNAINGFNGMPAKGLCFDCSDEEIMASVDHMVDGSK